MLQELEGGGAVQKSGGGGDGRMTPEPIFTELHPLAKKGGWTESVALPAPQRVVGLVMPTTLDYLLILRVRSPCARSVARVAGGPLIMRRLNDAVDLPLFRIHVVQPVVRANRLGVRGCSGANPRTRKFFPRSAGWAGDLASERGGSAESSKGGGAHRSCEPLTHGDPLER